MDRKAETIVKRTEKAGIRKSLKVGHVLTEEELLSLKVQLLSARWRITFALIACATAAGSYACYQHDLTLWSSILAVLSVLLTLFSIFGVKRTLSNILDSMDAGEAAEILGTVTEHLVDAVGSVFDVF